MDSDSLLTDDPSIPDGELLYRSVHPEHIKQDGSVTSSAFEGAGGPHISVDRASLSTPEETLARLPKHVRVVQLVTGYVRTITPGVASDPVPGNPAHAQIIRDPSLSRSKWKEVKRHLATACSWAISRAG